jgi:hypothetical protein
MDTPDILHLLRRINAAAAPVQLSVTALRPHGGGASHPWRAVGLDGDQYVVKYSWNSQELWLLPERHPPKLTVVKELLCGGLGQLFTPAVTPVTCVVDVSAEALSALAQTEHSDNVPPPRPSVGISYIEGSSYGHEQWADLFQHAPAEEALASIVVYMLWLNALDPEILVAAQSERLYSIDHGWYLTGQGWHIGQSTAPLEHISWSALPPFYTPLLDYVSDEALHAAVDQLQALAVEQIVAQFAHVPPEWGADLPFLAELAKIVLQRRIATPPAIEAYLALRRAKTQR